MAEQTTLVVTGYRDAKGKGVTRIIKLDGQVLYCLKKFHAEPDRNGQPVPTPERHPISREVVQSLRDKVAADSVALLADCDALIADIDAAVEV
jgi:hypothetical protein